MTGSIDCQFCSNLMDGFGRLPDLLLHIELGKLSDIIEMSCPHAGSIRRAWEAHWEALAPEKRLRGSQRWERILTAKGGGDMTLDLLVKERRVDMPSYTGETRSLLTARLILRPDEPGHAGTTWVLNPQWADSSIMRTWIKRCREEHGQKCEQPDWMKLRPETIAMPEWLVDVVDYCVVACPADTTRYVALSYTWGGVQCLKHTSENIEELKEKYHLQPDKRSDIPRTVRDAFEITRLLGERYLWVDSLCIPQAEPTTMARGLNSMHHIYANSIICLIAFAGTDANHGLRGIEKVSASRHVEQVIFDIADGERFCWIPDSCASINYKQPDAIEGSRYIERGWTWQEYVFAKRRLIFTDGLLHWTCQCADWSEETHVNLEDLPWNLHSDSTFWMTSAGPNLALVERAAGDFNTRYFRYGEDVSKAFLGIQNHISRDFLGGFHYGHPQLFFDISLLWRVPTELRSRCKRRLSGTANSDPPSWSWMGWQCHQFFFEKDEEHMMYFQSGVGFTQSVAQWYIMQNSLVPVLDLQPVNCQWQIHRAAVKNSSARVPSGWQRLPAPCNEWDSEYCYRRESFDGSNSFDYYRAPFHSLDPDFDPTDFKYPIPLPTHTEMCISIEQRPFLYTRTTRSFFLAKAQEPLNFLEREVPPPWTERFPFKLLCHDGQCAGLLWLHDELDEPCVQVEVVAVVKGWTTILSQYFSVFEEREDPVSPDRPLRHYDDGEYTWTIPSLSCFFVLCVEWENGIAKRQGTGIVEADIWEQNQEPVDLILG